MGSAPRDEIEALEIPRRHPVDGLTLPAVRPAAPCGDLEHLEPHPAVRVLAGEPDERTGVEHLDPYLLPELAGEGVAGALARLELAARELPLAREMASGQALGREHPPVGPTKDAHRDVNRRGLPAGRCRTISHPGPDLRSSSRFPIAYQAQLAFAGDPGAPARPPARAGVGGSSTRAGRKPALSEGSRPEAALGKSSDF